MQLDSETEEHTGHLDFLCYLQNNSRKSPRPPIQNDAYAAIADYFFHHLVLL